MGIDGRSADDPLLQLDRKTMKFGDLLEHLGALAHHLGPDAVSR
jgi:hypothetical protein